MLTRDRVANIIASMQMFIYIIYIYSLFIYGSSSDRSINRAWQTLARGRRRRRHRRLRRRLRRRRLPR